MSRLIKPPISQPAGGESYSGAALAEYINEVVAAVVSGHFDVQPPVGAGKGLFRAKQNGDDIQIVLHDGDSEVVLFEFDVGDQLLTSPHRNNPFDLTATQLGISRENHLINSGFDISGRGDFSSSTAVTSGAYYWDRWQASTDVTAVLIEDQPYQGSKTVKLTANSAIAAGQLVLDQRFEFPSRYQGRLVTVSVPVWSNSDKAHVNIYDSGFHGLKSEAHAGDGNMQLLKVTGILRADVSDLRVRIGLSDQGNTNIASGDYFRFGRPKFELASDASPYEVVPISRTKLDCLRFFERVGTNYESYANLSTWLYDSAYGAFFHSPKRAAPAISHGGVPGDYRFRSKGQNYTVTGFDFAQMQSDRFRMGVTLLGGPSVGSGGWLSHISGTTYFDVDAEIYG